MLLQFKKNNFFLFILFFSQSYLFGQTPNIEWQRCYGGIQADEILGMKPKSNGGSLIVGESYSSSGTLNINYGQLDAWAINVDNNGNVVWKKNFGGTRQEMFSNSIETQDGGFIFSGQTNSYDGDVNGNHGMNQIDIWVVKTNQTGIIEWQKCLGGSLNDIGSKIIQSYNGGYLVFGSSFSTDGDLTGISTHGQFDWWVISLNANGNILWSKTYGGSKFDWWGDISKTSDGNYIITGKSQSVDGDLSNGFGFPNDSAGWVVKIDTSGNIIWEKSYGSRQLNVGDDLFNSVQNTSDGGYILAGNVSSNGSIVNGHHGETDFWVVKLDSFGNFKWQQCYGGSGNDRAYAINPTQDGGWVIVGTTRSNDFDVNNLRGLDDIWVIKISNTGILEWQKCLGGNLNELATSIYQINSGGFMVAGSTLSSNNGDVGFNNGSYDMWLVKLSPETTVPIRLDQYNARALGSNSVLNTWQTAQEINSSHFVVERSIDGRNFNEVGRMQAATNSMVMRNYRFTDQTVDFNANGIYYYRLKMVDLDGSASYSQIEKVTNSTFQSIIIFPNPVREVLNIQLYAEQQENALIQIYDLKGSLITKRKINITKGANLLKQEVFNLADGSYYVVIQGSRVWKAYFVKE